MGCGEASSENQTYLYQRGGASGGLEPGLCRYQICKANDNICRIRLDFTVSTLHRFCWTSIEANIAFLQTFVIEGPQVGTASDWAATTDNEVYGAMTMARSVTACSLLVKLPPFCSRRDGRLLDGHVHGDGARQHRAAAHLRLQLRPAQ